MLLKPVLVGFRLVDDVEDYKIDDGLSEEVVRSISKYKNEPEWMTEIRIKAYNHFCDRSIPTWGNSEVLNSLNLDDIWKGVEDPDDICSTTNLAIINSTEFIQQKDLGEDDDDYNPGF